MLNVVIKEYKDQFTVIFKKACEHLETVFDIQIREVDPTTHSYVLVNVLDLIYERVVIHGQRIPPNGLLMILLGVILLEDNCIPEEEVWELLSIMGLHAGKEHVIYGEPRKLITEDWVQKQYLQYRQVPNSDPATYEFLWGPRAYAETSKLKVLEFLAKINGTNINSFSSLYEEALRDEEERDQARIPFACSITTTLGEAPAPCPTGGED
ncbi:melanoma-associated antigen B10-like [Rhynchocyon petersi]